MDDLFTRSDELLAKLIGCWLKIYIYLCKHESQVKNLKNVLVHYLYK